MGLPDPSRSERCAPASPIDTPHVLERLLRKMVGQREYHGQIGDDGWVVIDACFPVDDDERAVIEAIWADPLPLNWATDPEQEFVDD